MSAQPTNAIRQAAVAGSFYPASAAVLRRAVEGYLAEARGDSSPAPVKALIAPHAGYLYSGPIAGSAFARLTQQRGLITRVVLLGPSHCVGFRGIARASALAFRTPLGEVPLDGTAGAALADVPAVMVFDRAHRDEHALEVEVPFLQVALDSFTLVPLVVGDATGAEVGAVIDRLWGGPETLIVVSSDLSHYLPWAVACAVDAETSAAIVSLEGASLSSDRACGWLPIQGLLLAARTHGLQATAYDLRNSGDTAGDKEQVVGYGAYGFHG